MKVQLIRSSNMFELQQEINHMVKMGYDLQGNVAISLISINRPEAIYLATMVKRNES